MDFLRTGKIASIEVLLLRPDTYRDTTIFFYKIYSLVSYS